MNGIRLMYFNYRFQFELPVVSRFILRKEITKSFLPTQHVQHPNKDQTEKSLWKIMIIDEFLSIC